MHRLGLKVHLLSRSFKIALNMLIGWVVLNRDELTLIFILIIVEIVIHEYLIIISQTIEHLINIINHNNHVGNIDRSPYVQHRLYLKLIGHLNIDCSNSYFQD